MLGKKEQLLTVILRDMMQPCVPLRCVHTRTGEFYLWCSYFVAIAPPRLSEMALPPPSSVPLHQTPRDRGDGGWVVEYMAASHIKEPFLLLFFPVNADVFMCSI